MDEMPYTDKKKRVYKYGEFFPAEFSPVFYNETIAQEYFPLTKEQASEQGYWWKDPDVRDYKITKKSEDLPDSINDVSDSILDDVQESKIGKHPNSRKNLSMARNRVKGELNKNKGI